MFKGLDLETRKVSLGRWSGSQGLCERLAVRKLYIGCKFCQLCIKAWWQSGLMRKTRNLVPSGASVRIRPTSISFLTFRVHFLIRIFTSNSSGSFTTFWYGTQEQFICWTMVLALNKGIGTISWKGCLFTQSKKRANTEINLNQQRKCVWLHRSSSPCPLYWDVLCRSRFLGGAFQHVGIRLYCGPLLVSSFNLSVDAVVVFTRLI